MKVSVEIAEKLRNKILDSKKYRDTGLNTRTIDDLIGQEAVRFDSEKDLLKAVRRKLHNIVAPYLGEPDYKAYSERLEGIRDLSLESPELREFCLDVLREHASTAERIPFLEDFYQTIFEQTGLPSSLHDLACGLHPIAFPWMGLPLTTLYHAYDIIQPRIDFINHFFSKIGLSPLAENRDVLVDPPELHADLALFLKEAHRFEKRDPGCNRGFWKKLNTETLAVSLPSSDLAGSHSLTDYHRKLVNDNLPAGKIVREIEFYNEMVFLIGSNTAEIHA
jgi:16S rRNA (guanine(1405)-N(7))-methyltransferase